MEVISPDRAGYLEVIALITPERNELRIPVMSLQAVYRKLLEP